MQALIARTGVVPVVREPSLRSEQVTQLVLGETALVLEQVGDWVRARGFFDGYEGWVHQGYVVICTEQEAAAWRSSATGWSDGAVVETDAALARLPIRARVRLANGVVHLPDGRQGPVVAGRILPEADALRSARRQSPEAWAALSFAGTPYQWGGVTTWGVDCSGLVQTVFAARGLALPRDASQQAESGTRVEPSRMAPGDLLFFTEGGARITHVALAGQENTLVHSTVSCGGFVVESWGPGTRAEFLRARLAMVRRMSQ